MLSLTELCAKLFEGAGPLEKVLFRVDAGRLPGLSFGHLSRCVLLSRAIKTQGANTALLMRDIREGVEHARAHGEHVQSPTTEMMRQEAAQALVIDIPYDPEQAILAEARRQGMWIVYIDDTGRSHIKADVVLNTNILAEPWMYPHVPRKLLGLEHFFLDAEDAVLCDRGNRPGNDTTADSDKSKEHSMRVAITFGGSDPTDLTFKALSALRRLHLPLSLDIVLGPGFASNDEIRTLAAQIDARVLVSPQRLLPILCEADLVVCTGGRTLYECATLGLQILAVASTAEEAKSIRAFTKRGLIRAGLEVWDANTFTHELKKICTAHP